MEATEAAAGAAVAKSEARVPGRGSGADVEGTIWRKAVATTRGADDDSARDHFHEATRGVASEIPFRSEMERSFGHDFSGVKAYLGRSAPLAELGAEAATRGEQVAFASSSPSRDLVAHELTHVVQARVHGAASGGPAVSSPSHGAEHEAEAVAERVLRGEPVTVGASPSAEVSRRGPAYTVRVSDELETYGLGPHAPVVVLDEPGQKIDREELGRRAESGEQVLVRYRQERRKIPARLLDLDSFRSSTDDDHDNPDNGPYAQSKFSTPRAVALDNGDLVVEIDLQTKNRWDRASWAIELEKPGRPARRLREDRSWWNNPAWKPQEMNEQSFQSYAFLPSFDGLPKDGRGEDGWDRKIVARIPQDVLTEFFDGGLSESSKIIVGMKVQYDSKLSPVTADDKEFQQAFGFGGQYHGEGIFRTREDGYVDLGALAGQIKAGDWASDKEVWEQPLQDNPRPNLLRSFPGSYLDKHDEMRPLAPVGTFPDTGFGTSSLELATRIENEATLALSNLGALQDLVMLLESLVGNDEEVTRIMHAGPAPLGEFRWSLHAENEGKPMVFTDKYMDDPGMRALRSGVGIRRRHTTKATKLNVKTGEGHNVGTIEDGSSPGEYTENRERSSDIYRRHEIGFDLNPDATPRQIGTYLRSGLGGHDPWNKAGDEANRTAREKVGEDIDYAELDYRMVLQGHRTKFKLSAVSKEGATINIEISCDHTVGRTFENYQQDGGDESDIDPFDDVQGRYQHIYNVEMELEHLGAGKQDSTGSTTGTTNETAPSQLPSSESTTGESSGGVTKRAPPGHPGRMYLRDDTRAPQFNTPSFQVFYRAHQRFVDFARNEAEIKGKESPGIGPDELNKAPQKLEALYAKLEPELLPEGIPDRAQVKPPRPDYQVSRYMATQLELKDLEILEVDSDGDCFYNAVIQTAGLGCDAMTLRNEVAAAIENRAKFYARYLGSEPVETVVERIRTPGAFAGVDGDVAPSVLADLRKLAITIIQSSQTIAPQTGGTPVTLVRFSGGGLADHYDGTRPRT